ncbi:protein of unknown function DUF336 [Gluconacetobacter diazotrophicus PA1 5]|uniref:UPF0303 protein GDI1201 n=3 Tax=Gluconacetobacter diazotrophicus TaxID=33996 RepID=A9HDU3_GLUDA|nr:heme-degrading domain-containing protein [Gluconacetobacter diazotrophicus]ACI51674.1 protein of unknown function DUF336 [Gluconacetobacter diazotrophicus PA1 5]MBB2155294.1 heme-degrading domain-containing protein [Gluconacetobacter diazotrophicus]TWB11018.1 uncharacterized protein (UPF0303 family) [Gluconacetobacter diazotrophicus]CAP55144.1 conserved protein [Gluconacetobacter diazotrophicus PA1 5]
MAEQAGAGIIRSDDPALARDLERIARQERELILPGLTEEDAWIMGCWLRQTANERRHPIAIDIRRGGHTLFSASLDGATPDNLGWIARKARVAARFHRSSYAVGLQLLQEGKTIAERFGLPEAEYAPFGGAFPLRVRGVGVVGTLCVSGLPQREDHRLVVEALATFIDVPLDTIQIPS